MRLDNGQIPRVGRKAKATTPIVATLHRIPLSTVGRMLGMARSRLGLPTTRLLDIRFLDGESPGSYAREDP